MTLRALFLIACLPLQAAQNPVKASLISMSKGFSPGQSLTLGLRIQAETHWHTYWRDPGDAGLPTALDLKLPQGLKATDLQWPKPQVFKDPGGLVGYGYEGETLLPFIIKIPASYHSGTLEIKGSANWLVCKDVCIPGSAELSLSLPQASGPSPDAPLFNKILPSLGKNPEGYHAGRAEQARPLQDIKTSTTQVPVGAELARPKASISPTPSGLPQDESLKGVDFDLPTAKVSAPSSPTAAPSLALMLLFAFIGGLILNLMPCVLPVLSLKVMAFVRQSQESRSRSTALGLAFSLGAIASFWALAALVITARAAGQSVGWGFQFQSPAFVVAMACVVTAFALNLLGVFELYLPGRAHQAIHEAGGREGLPGAFLTGAFMTLLATPCTAPFLGTALGFAFSQSSLTLFLVFTFVGLGLAAPYQILSTYPGLMRWVPKPGKWMQHFRQFMAFPLFATLLWLLWVLGKQTGVEFVVWTLAFLLALGLVAWIYGAFAPLGSSWARLLAVALINALILLLSYHWLLSEPMRQALSPQPALAAELWEPYSLERIELLKKQGKTVFVDFTAEWCWTCKVNERVALNDETVRKRFEELGIVKMKADWTKKDAAITAALAAFGRSGVPFYAFYSPKFAEPLTLAEVITPAAVLAALERLK